MEPNSTAARLLADMDTLDGGMPISTVGRLMRVASRLLAGPFISRVPGIPNVTGSVDDAMPVKLLGTGGPRVPSTDPLMTAALI